MRIRRVKLDYMGLITFSLLILGSCATPGKLFKQEYAKVWKETIKSEAWRVSIEGSNNSRAQEQEEFYASSEDLVLDDNLKLIADNSFTKKYSCLVSDAYYKIIAEAEKSDKRLKEEYNRLYLNKTGTEGKTSKQQKESLAMASKKYEAHKEMLVGLKSWNIMSEYGSDDLEFFEGEHKPRVEKMIKSGQSEEVIINYLVYKLADLYHFDQ